MPTINELRAFEAAARLRSISGAAHELGCSQPCVTHRIKALERRWATALFQRTTRSVEWTRETQAIYDRVRNALAELEAIAAEFTADTTKRQLTITLSPSLASSWLVPRLNSWRARHPDIELKLSATNRYVDLVKEGFDAGIRLLPHGGAIEPGMASVKLADERLVVVAGPAYAARWAGGFDAANLMRASLIWQEGTDHWQRYFNAFLGAGVRPPAGPTFNNADLAIRAATENQGVAIMREMLVVDALESGQLMLATEQAVECPDAYHFVAPRDKADKIPVREFRTWLVEAAAR